MAAAVTVSAAAGAGPRTVGLGSGSSARLAVLCALAIGALWTAPCWAQKQQPPLTGTPSSQQQPIPAPSSAFGFPEGEDPSQPSMTPGVITVNSDSLRMVEAEACNAWTESGVHSPTVSVSRLSVPDKASGEFQRACSSYKDKKFIQAEIHARKAVELYPSYSAGWVLLGQVLDAEHNRSEADKACEQAMTVDPQYVAPYLCLAEFAARDEDWNQLARLSDEALALDPTSNAYALYYSAAASYHLKHFADAETNVRASIQLDPWRHLPQAHLLLARLCEEKGDPRTEIAELKEFLKGAANSPDAPSAKARLKELEAPAPKQP